MLLRSDVAANTPLWCTIVAKIITVRKNPVIIMNVLSLDTCVGHICDYISFFYYHTYPAQDYKR